MNVVNETSLRCHFSRSQLIYADLLQAMIIAKATFEVRPDGQVVLAAAQEPVVDGDTDTPWGRIESEVVPRKAWCDVLLLGAAHAPPPGAAVPSMDVSLRIGETFSRRVRVTGERAWVRAWGAFMPSPPVPFTSMPLTYDRAYGGRSLQRTPETGEVPVPYFDNPLGRGYVAAKEHAEGTRLPNVEELDQLIEDWSDRPLPAGLGPLARDVPARSQRGVSVDLTKGRCRLDWSVFCSAHPRMSLPRYPAEAEVVGDGLRPEGLWRFRLPALSPWVRVELGPRRYQLPLTVDTLYLLPETRRLMLVARATLIYQFRPERRRELRLMNAPDETVRSSVTTLRELRASPSADIPVVIPQPRGLELSLDELAAAHPMTSLLEDLPLCASG